MKNITKLLCVSFLLLFFQGFAQNEKSLLWEISGKNLQKPSYLFGTIHAICEDDYIMTPVIENTLKNADMYCAEIDLTDMSQMFAMQQMMFAEKPLSERLSKKDYQEMKLLLKELFDKDIEEFEKLSDIAIMSQLTIMPFSCEKRKTYELELINKALESKKAVGGLETVKEQVDVLQDFATPEMNLITLKDFKKDKGKQQEELVHFYTIQDIDGLAKMMKEDSHTTDAMFDKFLVKRNKNWGNKIPEMSADKSVFYAVGAGHLGGKEGVLELLRKEGYTVKPIKINKQ